MSILTGDEVYLGDRVYASFDGYQIRLRCEAPAHPNVIYIDPDVFDALTTFADRIREEAVRAQEVNEEVFNLYAEREGYGLVLIKSTVNKEQAKSLVESCEYEGTWPEGCEAVLVDETGATRWVYTDTWEVYNP